MPMCRHTRGQSLVELAIVFPVLILLVFGAVDAVQIIMVKHTVQQAARVAAHQAALIGGPDGSYGSLVTATGTIADQARIVIDTGIGTRTNQATIAVTCAAPCQRYSAITVAIDYTGDVWIPIGPFKQLHANASATRASEQDSAGDTTPCAVPGC